MNGWVRLSSIAVAAALAGCPGSRASQDSGTGDAGGSEDAGGDGGTGDGGQSGGPITGTCSIRFHFIQDGGAAEQTTGCNLVAFVEAVTVSAGTATTYPATAFGSTFTIDGVPTGPFYLHFLKSGFYLNTSVRSFDLQSDQPGTANVRPATAGTVVDLSGSGFPPLQLSDALGMESWNANDTAGVGGFDAGDTSFSVSLSPAGTFPNLVDTTAGDDFVFFHQGHSGDAGIDTVYTLDSIATPSPVVMTDGQTTTAPNGVFSPVTLDQALTLSFDHAAFTALTAQVSPAAKFEFDRVDLYAVVGGVANGIFGVAPYLIRVYDDSPSASFGGVFPYGNPFPWSTELAHSHRAEYGIFVSAAGATSGAYLNAFVRTDVVEGTQASPEIPVMVPATGLSVGGRAAANGLTGIGTSPVVSWSAPATSPVSAYEVFVYSIASNGGQTVVQFVAEVRTVSTSLQIPPGILSSGQYLLLLRALSIPGVDLEATPFLSGTPYASAETVTGILTP